MLNLIHLTDRLLENFIGLVLFLRLDLDLTHEVRFLVLILLKI